VHFKNGKGDNGGAISNTGPLVLESCIFSGNQALYTGGAISTNGSITIMGCTFYNNKTTNNDGGAIWNNGTLTLAGSLVYVNTAGYGSMVSGGTTTSLGYNVSDKNAIDSGYTFVIGDKTETSRTVNTSNFKPLVSMLTFLEIIPIPITIEGFPTTDFYGNNRSTNVSGGYTAAGAVAAAD
jgi:predicted outer membrane repeat protein